MMSDQMKRMEELQEKMNKLSQHQGYTQAISDILKMLEHVAGKEGGSYKMTADDVAKLIKIAFDTLPKADELKKELGI